MLHSMEFPLWQNEVYNIQINFIKTTERLKFGKLSVICTVGLSFMFTYSVTFFLYLGIFHNVIQTCVRPGRS